MKKEERIERCIYLRPNGRYYAHVRLNCGYQTGTFNSLEEARAFRTRIEWERKKLKREVRAKGRDLPADAVAYEAAVQLISSSPRSTVMRDGRRYTVVHLPPTARKAA